MTIECYNSNCQYHGDDGPFCDEDECREESAMNEIEENRISKSFPSFQDSLLKSWRQQSFLAMSPTPRTQKEWARFEKRLHLIAEIQEEDLARQMNLDHGIWWKTRKRK